ncbi:sensor histidine kinase [Actinoplanes regularis]|uniref:sensor histidine kinase n=1 Tax=Actinoplanes regularis TaxID=52697 RepID=UPI0024A46EB0|nr:sensor histidine kinase [Actinoplanes regularis]GLW31812.1 two-component sensor histidine kinase [Actinoplanes regularis]
MIRPAFGLLPRWAALTAQLTAVLFVYVSALVSPVSTDGRPLGLAVYVLATLVCGAAAASAWWPRAALVVVLLGCLAYVSIGYPGVPLGITVPIALYHVARQRPTAEAFVLTMLTAATARAASYMTGHRLLADPLGWSVMAWCLLSGAAGSFTRVQAAYLASERDREQLRREQAEQQTRARVTEERLRIARDLHDVIGHSVASITVQSGVASHILDHDPEAARQALERINEVARGALDDIRATLGLLHPANARLPDTAPLFDPLTEGLPGLVTQARADGVPADFVTAGQQRELPVLLGRTLFRVAQEGLTNVVKHGQGVNRVTVRLGYTPDTVRLEVINDGEPVPVPAELGPDDPRRGLLGMRERMAAVGGTLEAGPLPEGGFRVEAEVRTATGEVTA